MHEEILGSDYPLFVRERAGVPGKDPLGVCSGNRVERLREQLNERAAQRFSVPKTLADDEGGAQRVS